MSQCILQYPQIYAIMPENTHHFINLESEVVMKAFFAHQINSQLVVWSGMISAILLAMTSITGCGRQESIPAAETIRNERISVKYIQPKMGDIIVTG